MSSDHSNGTEFVLIRRDRYSGDEEEIAAGTSPVEIEAQLHLLEGD